MMMTLRIAVLVGAGLLAAATFAARAQPAVQHYGYYPPYPYPSGPVPPALAAPPSWSYDPYTSGLGPCPQRFPGDPPCRDTIEPTYGQPSFWPIR
jgi:hypothetical protein